MKIYTEVAKELNVINDEINNTILIPITKGTKVKDYENCIKKLIDRVRLLRKRQSSILDELDLLYAENETKFDRGVHLWLTALSTAFEQVCFNFQNNSLNENVANKNTELFRSFMLVEVKLRYVRNQNINVEDLGIYYAYNLNEIKEKIEKRVIELKHPTKYFYNFSYHAIINTDQSAMAKRNHRELLHIFNDQSFQTQIKETQPLQIKDKLEYHLRYFTRNGGAKSEWITHTKALLPPNLTPEQKDSFLTWIENNEKQENKTDWDQQNIDFIRNHKYQVKEDMAVNKALVAAGINPVDIKETSRNTKSLESKLTNEQIKRIFELAKEITLFVAPFELIDLQNLFDSTTTKPLTVKNNQNLAWLFNYLQPEFITNKWQSIIDNNKCLKGNKGAFLSAKNLSASLNNVDKNSEVSKRIKVVITSLNTPN